MPYGKTRKHAWLAIAGLAGAQLLTLSGCTMIPAYQRSPLPVASRYPETSATEAAPTASGISWRDFFQDDRLKALIELALVNNRDLRVAVLNVEESRAQYRITRSASFPAVEGSGSMTRSKVSLAGFPRGTPGTSAPATFRLAPGT